jgi:plastocyanin
MPFVLTVSLHTTVTWRNNDSIPHVVMTTAQQSRFLNFQMFSFHIAAGSQAQFTFHHPGLYHYYDPTMSTWNSSLSRIAAKRGTPHFPLAMDGVIWVQGSIPGLPTSATNLIAAGHDEFTNEFLAISTPGGVTWHNFDTDPHFVGLVEGWSAPINSTDIGLYRIAGTADVPGGASTTAILNTAGLYYYYCRNHSAIDRFTHRAEAMSMASEYPIAMEGFILALPPS